MKFKELIDTFPLNIETITLKVEGEKGVSMIDPFGMIAEKLGDSDIVKVDTFNDTLRVTILPEKEAEHEA